jgi:sulfate adenylyltransferase subunit 2
MSGHSLTHLQELEAESIAVIRELAAQFERPVLLFSGGKDSIVVAHLARKAFFPGKIPFPLMHVDTGHNFDETIEFRDRFCKEIGAELIVRTVEGSIKAGRVAEEKGENPSRNASQTVTLLDAVNEFKFDAAMGGARRDEEKARSKERFFSFRNEFGQWDPKNQRPELWDIYNGKKHLGEHFRCFPISNWTEMDVWQYIKAEELDLPSIYFSHEREIVDRDGSLLATGQYNKAVGSEVAEIRTIRFRTVGDMTCTGSVESPASTLDDIIQEVASTRVTERGGRSDDRRSEAAMEDRKKQGYF